MRQSDDDIPDQSGPGFSYSRTSTVAALAAAVGVLPVFMVGGMAPVIALDLHMTSSQLGITIGAYFAAAGAITGALGSLADRIGSRRAIAISLVGLVACLAAIATVRSFGALAMLLAISGGCNALLQPSTNAFLAADPQMPIRGIDFGVKQAAIPAAGLMAGISMQAGVPAFGWRVPFVVAACVALVALAVLGRHSPLPTAGPVAPSVPGRTVLTPHLIALAAAAALASAVGNAQAGFLTSIASDNGWTASDAGLLLAVLSLLSMGFRVLAAVLADGSVSSYRIMAVVSLLTVPGLALMALGGVAPLVAGALLAFSLGWCWPGAMNFSVVQEHGERPAAATGVTQTGVFLGGGLGPVIAGVAAERSISLVYLALAVAAGVAALMALVSSRLLPQPTVNLGGNC